MLESVLFDVPDNPSLKNLTTKNYSEPPKKQNAVLQGLGAPHVESFNFMLKKLNGVARDIDPREFCLTNGDKISLRFESARIISPCLPPGTVAVRDLKIYPTECRQKGTTYKGQLVIQLAWSVNGEEQPVMERLLGEIPIMVKSSKCNISNLSPKNLVDKKEHADEFGGYFIVKGHERLIRILIMTRRNYPIAIQRNSWKSRGVQFSDKGVLIRCVKPDETSTNNVLHFITNGSVKLMFIQRRQLYFAPLMLILKALLDVTDQYIYSQLIEGMEDDLYYMRCIVNMMQHLHQQNLHTQAEIKNYIGSTFRVRFTMLPEWYTDNQVCDYLITNSLAIHLDSPVDKFNLFVSMTKKLFSFVQGKCRAEGADSVMMQELMLGGHLYLQAVKDKLASWLDNLQYIILKKNKLTSAEYTLTEGELQWAFGKSTGLEHSIETFLATGNIRFKTLSGAPQDKGLTIVAENINRMRYMSHFRAVHRGSFFLEMRSTEARQLLPDAWGFICPVHTPDGSPCGLLNHLASRCHVVTEGGNTEKIPQILVNLGMVPINSVNSCPVKECYTVSLDGKVLGYVWQDHARNMVDKLRMLKIKGDAIPNMTEIVLVPKEAKCGQFPGLFLFTGPARMMRPVINLALNQIEFIGTFEQAYLDICVIAKEAEKGITTHMEISETSFMSNLACLIPMPDCNQSPRNMYQCQMGKQTMGTPCHTWNIQSEGKLYRLQTPASPLFRPVHYDLLNLDDFAMGTNAIVAVISYTGYDMEDAMIINKSSYERGFAHGSILKSEFINLKDITLSPGTFFGLDPKQPELCSTLDNDGLPFVGTVLNEGDPFYCFFHGEKSSWCVQKFTGKETAYVNAVKLCNCGTRTEFNKVCISLRVPRNPSVGDKFASRAGQKGICSHKWPAEDLPFTESGLVPDIVFNPHGFPSRMTIAMMIECMAGKSAALHGLVHDATPFKFSEKHTAINYFGKLLESAGYNYYGTERMYSGVDGRELTADIFFGIVYYQRLRHMVSDKWQVRSTGPVDSVTHQPIKGRRRGGGVRFGEMERDSLIAHGASFLLQDRLFHCSDKSTALICRRCGSFLSPVIQLPKQDLSKKRHSTTSCRLCGDLGEIEPIDVPYILQYLVTQLASVNIKLQLDTVSC